MIGIPTVTRGSIDIEFIDLTLGGKFGVHTISQCDPGRVATEAPA